MPMQLSGRFLLAAVIAALADSVLASGIQIFEQSASGLGNAYAGSAAVAEDAGTIFFNPAGMTQLQAREVSVGVIGVNASCKFSDSGSNTGGLSGTGGNGCGTSVMPNGYLSWSIREDIRVGIGLGVPFGLATDYDDPWIGGAQSLMFDIKTYNINPSIAYRVNDRVSLGFGVDWQRMSTEYTRIVGVNPVPLPPVLPIPLTSSRAKLAVDGDGWGWNVGALVFLAPETKLGLSYRSAIKHKLDGSLSVTGPFSAFNEANTGPVTVDIKLPDTFIASLSHKLDERIEVLADVSWTGWSAIDKIEAFMASTAAPVQTLDTKFDDTWRFALGVTYTLDDAWKLKVGTAYDQTPVPDAEHRMVSLPDNDRLWLSVGAQWKPAKTSAVDFGLAYPFVKDSKIDNDQLATGLGRVTGSYSSRAWVFGLQYSSSF